MMTFHLKLGKGVQRQDTLWLAKRGQTMNATRKGVLAAAAVCGLLTCAQVARGASATWLGTADGTWATEENWSAAPVPGAGDTATFSGAGNGNTAISLGSGVAVGKLVFDTASAASYTVGSGGAGAQTLTLGTVGDVVAMGPTVAAAQRLDANLALATTGTYTLTNASTAAALTVAGGISTTSSGIKVLSVMGEGDTTVSGAITAGTGTMNLLKAGSGTLTLSGGGVFSGNGVNCYLPGSVWVPANLRQGHTRFAGGTYTFGGGEFVLGGVLVNGGAGNDAACTLDGATFSGISWLSVGRGNGTGAVSSHLVLTNAAAITASNCSAGYNGNNAANMPRGSVTMAGGSTLTLNGGFLLAESVGSVFAMTLDGGSQLVNPSTTVKHIGQYGTGTMTIHGGSAVQFGNAITYVGYRTGTGVLNVVNGTFSNAGELRVGGSDVNGTAYNAKGTLTVSGGTVSLGALTLARGNNNQNTASGEATVSGGTLVCTNDLVLGYAGFNNLGKLTVSGGIVNIGPVASKWLQVGVYDTSKGQVNIAGGALNLMNNSAIKMSRQAGTGSNVISQDGGNVTFYSDAGTTVGGTGDLDLQYIGTAASTNTYHLNGGVLTVSKIFSTAVTGTRVFNFNGGTLKAAVPGTALLSLGSGAARANVRDGGAVIDSNGKDITVAQALLHSNIEGDAVTDGGLTKRGAGVLTLTGASAYTGPTVVEAGTLTLSGSGAVNDSSGFEINGAGAKLLYRSSTVLTPPVMVTQGTLDGMGTAGAVTVGNGTGGVLANGDGTSEALSVGSLAFQGAAAVSLRVAGDNPGLVVSGALATTPANGKVTINIVSGPVWQNGGTYRLIQYGSYGGDVDAFELGSVAGLGARQSAELGVDSVNGFITLTVSGETLRWTGETNAKWAVDAELLNWRLAEAGTVTAFMANDLVLFDDQATGSTTVDISDADVSPAAVLFSNSEKNYTVSSGSGYGIVSGAIVKNGSGALSLNTANAYGGGTTVNGGSVTLGVGSALGTGAVALNAGTLDINGQSVGNAIGLNGGFLVGNGTLGGSLSGTGGIAKTTSGTLTLAAGGSYSGGTLLSAGTLGVTANYALGAGPLTLAGGTLQFTGDVALTNDIVAQNATTVAVAISGGNVDLFGNLSGSGTINANVAGTVYCGARLGGNNSGYSGTITMGGNSYARHKFYSPNAGSSNAFWTINGADSGSFVGFLNPSTIYLGALGGNANMRGGFAGLTVEIGALNQDSTFSGNFQSAALTLRKIGAGTLTLSGSVAYTGPTEVNGGVLSVTGTIPGGGTMNVNTNAKLAGTGTVGSAVIVNAGGRVAPGTTGIGTLTVGSLTLAQGGGLAFDLGAADASDKVLTSGALTLDGLSFADCVFTAAAGFGNGTYVLVDAASVIGSLGTVASGRLPSGKRGKFVVDAENGNLLLEVTNMGTMVRLQ